MYNRDLTWPFLHCYVVYTHITFTEEILAGEKGCVLNWSSGSVDDRHSREQVGLRIYIGSECKCIWTTITISSVSKCNGKKDI